MKPPTSKVRLLQQAVVGHDPSMSMRDDELQIGNAKVDDVDGTPIYPPGSGAYGRLPPQTSWDYTYSVREGSKQLRGECTERVGEVRYFGLGEVTLDVRCRCLKGGALEAELQIRRGSGKATLLPGHRFAVFGTRGSAQGKSARAILGYRFQSGKSVAAVDVGKRPRTYTAENVPAEQRLPLTCLYAGLLLHRPNK